MSLVSLKNLLGHASVEMTSHYIGLDQKAMVDGIGRFEALMRQHVELPSVQETPKIAA
jgi:hypothetical protein